MSMKKKILVINGSASENSANQKLSDHFALLTKDIFDVTVFNDLKLLPHFDPERSIEDTPEAIIKFREQIKAAHGILICTPEYVFSIQADLKMQLNGAFQLPYFLINPLELSRLQQAAKRDMQNCN